MLTSVVVCDRDEKRFCHRVAAVIIDRGRVLLQAVEDGPTFEEPFYCLPGGRGGDGGAAGGGGGGMSWHEIGLYFLVSLRAGSKLLTEAGPHYGVEEEAGIKFRLEWHDVTQLAGVRLLPSFLRPAARGWAG